MSCSEDSRARTILTDGSVNNIERSSAGLFLGRGERDMIRTDSRVLRLVRMVFCNEDQTARSLVMRTRRIWIKCCPMRARRGGSVLEHSSQ